MAVFAFTGKDGIGKDTECEVKHILVDTFPDHALPGAFPEEWQEE